MKPERKRFPSDLTNSWECDIMGIGTFKIFLSGKLMFVRRALPADGGVGKYN